MLAALLNALRVVGKRAQAIRVVVVGAGAAGLACADIKPAHRVDHVVVYRRGALYAGAEYSTRTARRSRSALTSAGCGARPTRCWSAPTCWLACPGPVRCQRPRCGEWLPCVIVFAMANPEPEVHPEEVRDDVAIIGHRVALTTPIRSTTARIPGTSGALEVRARTINEDMKLAAAHAIARVIPEDELHADYIIPSVFNRHVAESVAQAVATPRHKRRGPPRTGRSHTRAGDPARGDARAIPAPAVETEATLSAAPSLGCARDNNQAFELNANALLPSGVIRASRETSRELTTLPSWNRSTRGPRVADHYCSPISEREAPPVCPRRPLVLAGLLLVQGAMTR